MDVFRTNGQKIALKTPHGKFYSAQEVDEDITVETSNLLSEIFLVRDNNEPLSLGILDDMLQKNPEGAIDFW